MVQTAAPRTPRRAGARFFLAPRGDAVGNRVPELDELVAMQVLKGDMAQILAHVVVAMALVVEPIAFTLVGPAERAFGELSLDKLCNSRCIQPFTDFLLLREVTGRNIAEPCCHFLDNWSSVLPEPTQR